jgi:hypothetical protein
MVVYNPLVQLKFWFIYGGRLKYKEVDTCHFPEVIKFKILHLTLRKNNSAEVRKEMN